MRWQVLSQTLALAPKGCEYLVVRQSVGLPPLVDYFKELAKANSPREMGVGSSHDILSTFFNFSAVSTLLLAPNFRRSRGC